MKNGSKELQSQPATPQSPSTAFPPSLPVKPMTPADFKTIKRITRDVATITRLGEALICTQGELYTISMDSQFTPGEKHDVLAVDCLDCLRGDEYTLICGSVLGSSLKRAGEPLKGRYFAIRSGDIAPGKRYRKVDVVELERVE